MLDHLSHPGVPSPRVSRLEPLMPHLVHGRIPLRPRCKVTGSHTTGCLPAPGTAALREPHARCRGRTVRTHLAPSYVDLSLHLDLGSCDLGQVPNPSTVEPCYRQL